MSLPRVCLPHWHKMWGSSRYLWFFCHLMWMDLLNASRTYTCFMSIRQLMCLELYVRACICVYTCSWTQWLYMRNRDIHVWIWKVRCTCIMISKHILYKHRMQGSFMSRTRSLQEKQGIEEHIACWHHYYSSLPEIWEKLGSKTRIYLTNTK